MSVTQPNIIFLMTDQQRWDALGCVNPLVRTPVLDGLAADGIRFDQAVCQAPLCIPSRSSLMFGLYPQQTGVRTNADGLPAENALPGLPLPELLRRAGYQTAGFGKTHWGFHPANPVTTTRGFEIRAIPHPRGIGCDEHGALMMGDDDPAAVRLYDAETRPFGPGEENALGYLGCSSRLPLAAHRDHWTTRQCLNFLHAGPDPRRPLFLYLSFLKPHAGFNIPTPFENQYRLTDIPDIPQPPWDEEPQTHLACDTNQSPFMRARATEWRTTFEALEPAERRRTTLRYWANCTWLDACFGDVLATLRALGRLDHALIVFTSDHGELLGERRFRFSKYCLYDSAVRVPLILSGSVLHSLQRGSIDQRNAELVDLYPTLANLAGGHCPAPLPGLDLLGTSRRSQSTCSYFGSGFDAPPGIEAHMARTPEWKFITFGAPAPPGSSVSPWRQEFYRLRHDPHEWRNVIDDLNQDEHEFVNRNLLQR